LLASLLLVTSVFIAMLSFHNTIGRYTFAMARERVLFAVFANVGHRSGRFAGATAPPSLLQTGLAATVLTVFMASGGDPVGGLFTWASSGAAVGILLVLAGVSVAAVLYFGKGGGANEHVLVRTGLPIAGAIAGGGWAVVTVLGSTGRCGRRRSWRPARCRRRRTA
jgi:amino acid transporter